MARDRPDPKTDAYVGMRPGPQRTTSAFTDKRTVSPVIMSVPSAADRDSPGRRNTCSVTWNDHLRQYLSAFNDFCAGSTSLVLRTAPRPEGPWSEPVNADLTAFGPGEGAYAGQIHGSLGSGREPIFTYYQQISNGIGKLRMGRLRLR